MIRYLFLVVLPAFAQHVLEVAVSHSTVAGDGKTSSLYRTERWFDSGERRGAVRMREGLTATRALAPIAWNGLEAPGTECRFADGVTVRSYAIRHAAAGVYRSVAEAEAPAFFNLPAACVATGALPVRLEFQSGNWALRSEVVYRVRSIRPADGQTSRREVVWTGAAPLADQLGDAEERIPAQAPAHKAMAIERVIRLAWRLGEMEKVRHYAAMMVGTPMAARYHLHNAHTMLGLLALRQGDTAAAVRHLKDSGAPEPVPVRVDLVEPLLAAGQLEAVADFYQAATTTENQELRKQYQGIAASLRKGVVPPLGRTQPKL